MAGRWRFHRLLFPIPMRDLAHRELCWVFIYYFRASRLWTGSSAWCLDLVHFLLPLLSLITSSCLYSIIFSCFFCIEVDLIGYWHVNKESRKWSQWTGLALHRPRSKLMLLRRSKLGSLSRPHFGAQLIFLGDVFIIFVFLREQNLCICDRGSSFYL